MFQKSLLGNFIKSFNILYNTNSIKLVSKVVNGTEFITPLAKFLNCKTLTFPVHYGILLTTYSFHLFTMCQRGSASK